MPRPWTQSTSSTGCYGDVTADGVTDLTDILCVADGFQGLVSCPIERLDVAPCGGDGRIDLDDLLAVIDSFAGQPQCVDPCLE